MSGILALQMKLVLQVFFTLAVFSFLYRDNPIYRFAEHAFVGVAAGYLVVVQFHTVIMPNLVRPLRDEGIGGLLRGEANPGPLLLIVPAVLGFMTFFKFSSNQAWLARWPMAVVIGYFSGAAIIGSAQGDLIPQIQANIVPIVRPGALGRFFENPGLFPALDVLYNPILIVGTACCLVYFFFSKEHRGATGSAAAVGIWFLMISFGASYGSTVMTRVSLFLERAYFLLKERTSLPAGGEIANWKITVPMLVLVVGFLVAYRLKAGPEKVYMYCPECRGEYRPGIEMCPTCEVALTENLSDAPPRRGMGPRIVPRLLDLVGFIDEHEARDARRRLKEAKIGCELVIRDAAGSNGDQDVGDEFWIRVEGALAESAADVLGLELALSESNCPSCGAPLDEGAARCSRCGS